MPCRPKIPKPKSLTLAALYAWHPTQTYIGYANAPPQLSKNPGTPCSTKPSQPISANSWHIPNNNRHMQSPPYRTQQQPAPRTPLERSLDVQPNRIFCRYS